MKLFVIILFLFSNLVAIETFKYQQFAQKILYHSDRCLEQRDSSIFLIHVSQECLHRDSINVVHWTSTAGRGSMISIKQKSIFEYILIKYFYNGRMREVNLVFKNMDKLQSFLTEVYLSEIKMGIHGLEVGFYVIEEAKFINNEIKYEIPESYLVLRFIDAWY